MYPSANAEVKASAWGWPGDPLSPSASWAGPDARGRPGACGDDRQGIDLSTIRVEYPVLWNMTILTAGTYRLETGKGA